MKTRADASPTTALFIPLKAQFFDAFAAGTKRVEYRRAGKRWNAKTCALGRAVLLSGGYGKQARLTGKIASYEERSDVRAIPGWLQCFGAARRGVRAACIGITLDPGQ